MSVSSLFPLSMLISIKFYVSWQLLKKFEGYVPEISKFGILRRREIFRNFFFDFWIRAPHQTPCAKFQLPSFKFHFFSWLPYVTLTVSCNSLSQFFENLAQLEITVSKSISQSSVVAILPIWGLRTGT